MTFYRNIKYSIPILIIFLICTNVYSQTDTEFWFAAPEVSSNHGDLPIYLRISSLNKTAHIIIEQPANPDFTSISTSVPANETLTIDLSPWLEEIENFPYQTRLNKGLHILSDVLISVYYEIANQENPEIFPLKGENALGTIFFIPGQSDHPNTWGNESVNIVAVEDETIITITPSIDIENHAAGIPFEIELNKGETYAFTDPLTIASSSLAGTKVVSDKAIAISISDDSVDDDRPFDLIGDQLVPIDYLGLKYIIIKGEGIPYNKTEMVYIMAIENNTSLFIDGSSSMTAILQEGETYAMRLNQNTLTIEADKKIYVYHLSGHSNEMGSALLPKIVCTGSKQLGFVRTYEKKFDLMILCKAEDTGNFILNGNSSVINGFRLVPSSQDFAYYKKEMSLSEVPAGQASLIKNTSGFFHMGILNKHNLSSEYGYFSNYSSVNLGRDFYMCPGDSAVLDAGPDKDSYLWNTGDTTQTISIYEPGTYSVEVRIGPDCTPTDNITVSHYPIQNIYLGSDTFLCEGETINLDAGPDFINYEWNTGDDTQQISAFEEDIYWVKATDTNYCNNYDSLELKIFPLPVIDLGEDRIMDDSVIILEAGQGFSQYLWNDSSRLDHLIVRKPGIYNVSITDSMGCSNYDEIVLGAFIKFWVPNAFTPNNDGINDVFKPKALFPNYGSYRLLVFNRSGQLIFESEKLSDGWDGSYKNKKCPAGVYVWQLSCSGDGVVTYGEENNKQGTVTLLR